jgi:DNA-binding Xre family transcriptional regulator
MKTKLSYILQWKQMSQRDLQRAIQEKFGFKLGDDRISKIVSGKMKNFHLQTAKMIADTLEISIDDIVEL